MRIPPRLKKGDKIGIVAPARKISPEKLAPALRELESWGLRPVLGENLYAEDHQYAGTDDQRRSDLQTFCDDPEIRAILLARGGYGTLRIIDGLSLKGLKKNPKWVIGFSDYTALSIQLYNAGIANLHAPMGISWDGDTSDAASREFLRRILMEGGNFQYSYTPERQDLTRTGIAEGRVVGGNLSLLSQLLGTETDFKTKGCLLFFEDLSEYLYHIDRMMVHLKRGGKLADPAGLIVGGMTDLLDNSVPFGKTAEEIVDDAVGEANYPVCYGFPTGHWPRNYPLVVGHEAQLRVSHTAVEFEFNLG